MEETFVVSNVEYDEALVRPIILEFQSGKIPQGFEDNLTSQVYQDRDNSLVVACAAKNILYTDRIKRNNNARNTFLAIPNKKGTKVRLVAVDLIKLTPKKEEDEASDSLMPELVTTDLYKEFGGKRVKRALEQRAKLEQSFEDVRDNLENTVAEIELNNDSFLNKSANIDEYKPPINADAVTLEDVYEIDSIVSRDVLKSLSRISNKFLEDKELEDDTITTFVREALNNIKDSQFHTQETICEMWLYADYLIKYLAAPIKTLTKNCTVCSYSELVNNDILDKFSILASRKRNRPNILRDKCICYLLVICVVASGYKLNITNLAKVVKVGLKKMQAFARSLRFVVKDEFAILKLPLPAAVSDLPHQRKKK